MLEKLEVLVVEDDPEDCMEMVIALDKMNDIFHLTATTDSSDEALKLTHDYLPDVVILDLELHEGSGDGIDYLKGLKAMNMTRPPFILITTNNLSRIIKQTARELGADYIFTKTQTGYSAEKAVEFLAAAKSQILSRREVNGKVYEAKHLQEEERDKRYRRLIFQELNIIGVTPNAVGYKYLVDAIILAINGEAQGMTQNVAKKYKKNESAVERAMQNAINRAWTHSDPQVLLKNYTALIRSSRGVPSITEFVFYYSKKISVEL